MPAPDPVTESRRRPDRIVVTFPTCAHKIVGTEVVVECECGELFAGDDEDQATRDWEIHAADEDGPA